SKMKTRPVASISSYPPPIMKPLLPIQVTKSGNDLLQVWIGCVFILLKEHAYLAVIGCEHRYGIVRLMPCLVIAGMGMHVPCNLLLPRCMCSDRPLTSRDRGPHRWLRVGC